VDSFSGVEKLYNQGNQPCLHQSWLFNYSGKPWLSQKWTRIICNEFYGTEPLHGYGYGQDEDQGQLGAWYVMAALGLFDVQGHAAANPTFQFGSPQFKKVIVQLSNDPDKKLVIETKNNSAENYYVKELVFNDETIKNTWMEREKLMQGGKLTFTMDSIPNKNWGVATPPPSMSGETFKN
ncbi:MAG TPA: glycoside hydrolase domain-containing protein, partial [Tangfeifania sp.]|nr:glycoside hydrolase domain-containing protein [Tangfeifania sp.]